MGDWRAPSIQVAAARESLSRIRRFIAERQSFVHETTLSGFTQVQLAEDARRDGWGVDLTFIVLREWTLSADRVAARVARGGHDVPHGDLERRFGRTLENFWRILDFCDEWHLLDNSGRSYTAIASGTSDEWVIYDHTTFQALDAFRRT